MPMTVDTARALCESKTFRMDLDHYLDATKPCGCMLALKVVEHFQDEIKNIDDLRAKGWDDANIGEYGTVAKLLDEPINKVYGWEGGFEGYDDHNIPADADMCSDEFWEGYEEGAKIGTAADLGLLPREYDEYDVTKVELDKRRENREYMLNDLQKQYKALRDYVV